MQVRIRLKKSPASLTGERERMAALAVATLLAPGALAAFTMAVWIVAARLLESQLYGVNSRDPLTLIGSIVILSLVAAAAGFVPAFRAARIDPIAAIRE